jgi:hypothetical protein
MYVWSRVQCHGSVIIQYLRNGVQRPAGFIMTVKHEFSAPGVHHTSEKQFSNFQYYHTSGAVYSTQSFIKYLRLKKFSVPGVFIPQ